MKAFEPKLLKPDTPKPNPYIQNCTSLTLLHGGAGKGGDHIFDSVFLRRWSFLFSTCIYTKWSRKLCKNKAIKRLRTRSAAVRHWRDFGLKRVGALGQSYASGARRQILFVGALSLIKHSFVLELSNTVQFEYVWPLMTECRVRAVMILGLILYIYIHTCTYICIYIYVYTYIYI